MLSTLAAVAAAFTLQATPQPTAVEAICQVNQNAVRPCQIAMAEQDGAIGLFFAIDEVLIGFVGTQVTSTKIAVNVVGVNDQAVPVASGYCQIAQGIVTCTATDNTGETLTVRARPTQ